MFVRELEGKETVQFYVWRKYPQYNNLISPLSYLIFILGVEKAKLSSRIRGWYYQDMQNYNGNYIIFEYWALR